MAKEERQVREDNLRLQRKLQLEVERRTALCRHLSESESSLEMEEERQYNEMASNRCRTSSPLPFPPSPCQSRPLSPGSAAGTPGNNYCFMHNLNYYINYNFYFFILYAIVIVNAYCLCNWFLYVCSNVVTCFVLYDRYD